MAEVWIIDVEKQAIEQYTQPLHGQYTQLNKILPGNTIASKTPPMVQFTTDQLF